MTSKVFRDIFLMNENDRDILKAQYVTVSSRIVYKERRKNIINGRNLLFPDPNVCMGIDDEEIRERYMNQLANVRPFLSTIIKGSIEEKYNIIFICTKSENKLHYLQYLSEFIYMDFGYPCYEYSKYASGASQLIKYKKDKVLKICNANLEKAKKKHQESQMTTDEGRKEIMKDYKKMKKKELRKILEARNLYSENMDKKDMLEMIELFM